MRKIKRILCTIVFIIIFCSIVSIFIPQLGEAFKIITYIEWLILKLFFFDDMIKTVIIWFFLAIVFFGGVYLSKKQEKKIWFISSLIVDVIGYIVVLAT